MKVMNERDTMIEVEIVVGLWKTQQTPAWRAVQRIAELIMEFQKAEWEREHS